MQTRILPVPTDGWVERLTKTAVIEQIFSFESKMKVYSLFLQNIYC